jgi:hypothetical protein
MRRSIRLSTIFHDIPIPATVKLLLLISERSPCSNGVHFLMTKSSFVCPCNTCLSPLPRRIILVLAMVTQLLSIARGTMTANIPFSMAWN